MSKKKKRKKPSHYSPDVDPLELIRNMTSSGDCYIDFCRCNAIKYAFRIKEEDTDLKKIVDYATLAIDQKKRLKRKRGSKGASKSRKHSKASRRKNKLPEKGRVR